MTNVQNLDHFFITELFREEPTRSQRRIMQMVDEAIRSYATEGYDKTTFDKVAQACGVSRPLVKHYFDSYEELFLLAMRYVRIVFQKITVDALAKHSSPKGQLMAYIEATLSWKIERPHHAKVWMLFFYECRKPTFRDLNTELVTLGHKRIMSIVHDGIESGIFLCGDPSVTARRIQLILTGAVVSTITENLPDGDQALVRNVIDTCMQIVGTRSAEITL